MYNGRFTGDYKAAFSKAVDELLRLDIPVEFRISQIEVLTEAYYEQTGKRPDPNELQRLTDFILLDDLSDAHPDKVSNTEYPILSAQQFRNRNKRERSGGDVAYYPNNEKHKLQGTRKAGQSLAGGG